MIVTRTPYRVSLAGGGTDFPAFFRERQTCVVSAALNKYFYLTLASRLDTRVRVAYSKVEDVPHAGALEHDIVRVVLERYGLHSGVEIGMVGEVPAGSGMGSSSAVTVGLLQAVRARMGLENSAAQLAEEAVRVETELLHKPIGWQDQYGVAFPGVKSITFGPGRDVHVHPIPLSVDNRLALEANAILVSTKHMRRAEAVLSGFVSRMEKNRAGLETIAGIARAMRAAFHAPRIDLPLLGALLDESWKVKRTLSSGATAPFIDEMYDAGRAAGAWGGKLLGAGGGGFLLFLIPPERHAALRSRLDDALTLPFVLDTMGGSLVYENEKRGP